MEPRFKYIARCSYGNDSIAMLQLMREHQLKDVAVVYSDTGWSSDEWENRVITGEAWVSALGWIPIRLPSIGFEELVLNATEKGMFPTRMRKFCTERLKILPFLKWAKNIDPSCHSLICVGVRRAESRDRRFAPVFMPERDDGRHVWHPIVEFSDEDRDSMIRKTIFEILPHKSKECEVCIYANRDDLRRASDRIIDRIDILEKKVGRPMFNPPRFMGAVGIREVRRWAENERGQFVPSVTVDEIFPEEIDPGPSCDDGWCGT